MGLLDKISDPYRLSMMINGLGLLGSKYEDQSARYHKGLLGTLSERGQSLSRQKELEAQRKFDAAQRDSDPLRAAQIRQLAASAGLDEQKINNPAQGFQGTGFNAQLFNRLPALAAKVKAGQQLTPQESYLYRMMQGRLSQPTTITGPDGSVYQQPGMDLNYLPQLSGMGAIATPVGSGDSGATPGGLTTVLPPNDPLRASDARAVVEAAQEAKTYSAMMPLFDAIEQDMQIFPTGKFADIELGARQWARTINMSDKDVAAAGERLQKNTNKLVSENMSFLKGAMSEGERKFTEKFSIGMDTSVEGNTAYIGFLRSVAQRAEAKAPMMRKFYRENNRSLDGFDAVWKDYIESNPIDIPEIGSGPTGQTYEYNPETGEIERR